MVASAIPHDRCLRAWRGLHASYRPLDRGRAGDGEHDWVGHFPAAGLARPLRRYRAGGLDPVRRRVDVPGACLRQARPAESRRRRPVRLHQARVRRPCRLPHRVGVLDFMLVVAGRARRRVRRLPRSLRAVAGTFASLGRRHGDRGGLAGHGLEHRRRSGRRTLSDRHDRVEDRSARRHRPLRARRHEPIALCDSDNRRSRLRQPD